MLDPASRPLAPAASLASLPPEILIPIAEYLLDDPRAYDKWNTETYTADQAALARTSRRLYTIVNPLIYQRNIHRDRPLDNCVLRAAYKGNLGTIQRAVSYGASLDVKGTWPPGIRVTRSARGILMPRVTAEVVRLIATPLHIALRHNHQHIVEYLLDREVQLHVPSLSEDRDRTGAYALETALDESNLLDAPAMLIKHGACLLRKDVPALDRAIEEINKIRFRRPRKEKKGLGNDLIALLLQQRGVEATVAALKYAAAMKDFELMEMLLSRPEADVSFSISRRTAIHHAAEAGMPLHIMKLILQREEANVAAVDNNNHTALHEAAAKVKCKEALTLLLERPECDSMARTKKQETPLHFAAREGNAEAVEALLRQPDVNSDVTKVGNVYPLHLAAASGSLKSVRLILESDNGDATVLDRNSDNTLQYAADGPDTEDTWAIVDLLVQHGVPPNHQPARRWPPGVGRMMDGVPAVDWAIKEHNFRTAMTLISHGAKAQWQPPQTDWQSLAHHVLCKPHNHAEELLAHLIDCGLDTDRHMISSLQIPQPTDGTPLLYAAALAKNLPCMRLLLENGAKIDEFSVSQSRDFDGVEKFSQDSLLTAVFRHEWESRRDPKPMGDVLDLGVSARVGLLLEHNASLDHESKRNRGWSDLPWGPSGLRWACSAACQGKGFGCLDLLLEKGHRRNISERHVRELIAGYKTAGKIGDQDTYAARIAISLEAFLRREFGKQCLGNEETSYAQEEEAPNHLESQ